MDELDQAILIGNDPSRSNEEKSAAAQYLTNVSVSPDGWRRCLEKLFSSVHMEIRFGMLNMLLFIIKHRYEALSHEEKTFLKQSLMRWMIEYCPNRDDISPAVKKKYAQLVAFILSNDYPETWPTVFQDILPHLGRHPVILELFLQILDAVDEVIVSREFHRSHGDQLRATTIKDSMRTDCIPTIASTWYQVLCTCQQYPILVQLALTNIKQYIEWIDISLIVNQPFLIKFREYMSSDVPEYRELCCECFASIAAKKMDFLSKLDLLLLLNDYNPISSVQSPDPEFKEKLAILLNTIGLESIKCRSQAHIESAPDQVKQKADLIVMSAIDVALTFLSDEYDDISAQVIPFALLYLHKIRHSVVLREIEQKHLEQFLEIICFKMKYDLANFDFDRMAEEEDAFLRYRQELEKLYHRIIRVDFAMVQNFLYGLLQQALSMDCTQLPMPEVEVMLKLFYLFKECDFREARQPIPSAAQLYSFYSEVMKLILASNVTRHPHQAISMLLYEILARYANNIEKSSGAIQQLLEIFLDERGIRHRNPQVRGRAAYDFLKMLDVFAAHFQAFGMPILDSLMPILEIKVNPAEQFFTDMNLENLYESAGIIAYALHDDPETHARAVQLVTQRPLGVTEAMLNSEEYKLETKENPVYSNMLGRSLRLIVRFSKGFKKRSPPILQVLKRALDLNMLALRNLPQSEAIRGTVMTFMHLMVEYLGKDLFPYLVEAVNILLQACTASDIPSLIRLVNQGIGRFKEDILDFIHTTTVALLQRIFVLHDQCDDTAVQAEILRHFYLFVNTLACNRLSKVLLSPETQPLFPRIFSIITVGCQGRTSYSKNTRTCVSIVENLLKDWALDNVPGASQIVIDNFNAIFLTFPLDPTTNIDDAESYNVVLIQVKILRLLLKSCGPQFVEWLATTLTQQLHPQQSELGNFLSLLTTQASKSKDMAFALLNLYKCARLRQIPG